MRVLLVDDDRESVAFLESVLQSQGHETTVAHDGQRALALAESLQPDLLILELLLPARSGFWVLETLHGLQIPAIVTTTVQKRQHREYAKELGVQTYLSKPFSAPQLLAAVSQVETGHVLSATA